MQLQHFFAAVSIFFQSHSKRGGIFSKRLWAVRCCSLQWLNINPLNCSDDFSIVLFDGSHYCGIPHTLFSSEMKESSRLRKRMYDWTTHLDMSQWWWVTHFSTSVLFWCGVRSSSSFCVRASVLGVLASKSFALAECVRLESLAQSMSCCWNDLFHLIPISHSGARRRELCWNFWAISWLLHSLQKAIQYTSIDSLLVSWCCLIATHHTLTCLRKRSNVCGWSLWSWHPTHTHIWEKL